MPLSYLVEHFGWAAYFTTLMSACGVAFLLLTFLRDAKSHVQAKLCTA
jgi:sugar phosphate permease